ncbi:MAG TPA: ABC transporter permease [Oscillospiraceae bacterium]|nr:ABC transporter permease [Oscillospiraceae bacterium]HPF55738.1 ABC transporter permease [Clostridiales bacterium]HPR74832.1 ABC transporter permease [Oscillospiraceae bacterium]
MSENKKMPKKNPLSFQLDLSKFTPASEEEKLQQVQMRERTTFFKDGMRRLWKNKIAMTCFFIILIILLMVVFVPMVYPYSYEQQLGLTQGQSVDSSYLNLKPFEYGATEQARIAAGEKVFPHIFGTDTAGRDYAIRVIYGARVSLLVGFFASIIVLIIGVTYGSIAGYFGGKVDLFMMRIVDIIYSLPDLLMIILLSVVLKTVLAPVIEGSWFSKLGTGMISIFIVFALLYWVSMARLIRGQILSIKQEEYVLTAKSIGASAFRIIRKHILPNCISIIIITTALQIPSAIFTESFLSFLGLGVSIPMPSLGSLASDALTGIYSYAYRLVIPAVFICLIVLSLNLLGDGLRDAFDPKLKN